METFAEREDRLKEGIAGSFPACEPRRPQRMLVVEDDPDLEPVMGRVARSVRPDVRIDWVRGACEARVLLRKRLYDVVLVDCCLSEESSGLALQPLCWEQQPDAIFAVMSAWPLSDYLHSVAGVGTPFLIKPFDLRECRHFLRSLLSPECASRGRSLDASPVHTIPGGDPMPRIHASDERSAFSEADRCSHLGRRLRLILAEDDPDFARLLARRFAASRRARYDVRCLVGIDAVLARLEVRRDDALILDLNLADSCGMSTITYACSVARHVPIVVLTGSSDPRLRDLALRAGAYAYLSKSLDFARIERAVLAAIERLKARRRTERRRSAPGHRPSPPG